ncbi:MAG: multiheme c-type cytochrome [Woeseiaceae bacterium]|nr:multiheme c-type cytochrome [Woeseiaceae bacterium]
MNRPSPPTHLAASTSPFAALAAGLAAVCLLPLVTAAAELPADRHLGVATCAASQCHGSAVARDGSAVLQNEYVTWTSHDPHAASYRTLRSDASVAMAARLGLANAHTADICLDCHADNVPAARRGERFQLSDGVGCEACHGGAERWIDTHYNTPVVSHADNLAAGLYPNERPAARAELCLSCHLGTDDRFATHRIMAAGHPRLAFELDTFTELWRTAGGLQHFRVDDDYRERKGAASHVETWATGLLADTRRRLALLQGGRLATDGLFPELGLFDCHACHRSMKSVQWRRLPRHGDADPGEPFIADGSFVMSMVLARAIAPEIAAAIEAALAGLHSARGAAGKRAAAAVLDREAVRLQAAADADTLRRGQRDIMNALLDAGAAGEYLDYGSAEQAFMAVQMLAFELGDAPLQEELDRLAAALQDDESYRPAQFARLLALAAR